MNKLDIISHFDSVSADYESYKIKNKYYYNNLKRLLRKLIPKNQHVLEYGCGTGDLLSAISPKFGYGYDPSIGMIDIAINKHKHNKSLVFSKKLTKTKFNYILMSDVIEHLSSPEDDFKRISALLVVGGKFIITMTNPIWEPFLVLAERLRLKMPEGPHNRISSIEVIRIANKHNMRKVLHQFDLLIPINIPLISNFINKFIGKFFRKISFIEYFVFEKV